MFKGEKNMLQNCVSEAFLERLPIYLNYLEICQENYISATSLSKELNLGEVQVRKDLAKISYNGKPKIGYEIKELMNDIKTYMGYDQKTNAVIIGLGQLGKALYHYPGFKKYNIHITQGFDSQTGHMHIRELKKYCQENQVDVGIIAVPRESAQEVCDQLVQQHIKAIWNFAPIRLNVPDYVIVQNENLADSLSILVKHLNDQVN